MMRCALVLLTLAWSGTAWAQPSTPAQDLQTRGLSTAFVRDESGVETRGKLLRLDRTSVVLIVDGRDREYDLAHVWSVQKRGDSLKNGAIIGSVVGLGFGLIGSAMAECGSYEEGYGPCGAGRRLLFAAVSSGVYSLIGIGIDALIPGRATLYQRPIVSATSARPNGLGVRFAVRW